MQNFKIARSELCDGVARLLENYQRCGITQIHSQTDETVAKKLRAALDLDTVGQPTVDAHSEESSDKQNPVEGQRPRELPAGHAREAERSFTESGPAKSTSDHSELNTQVAPASRSSEHRQPVRIDVGQNASGTQATTWSLPVLSPEERQNRLDELNVRVKACRLCTEIVSYRRQTVFGDGPLQPTICFLGEAPGADEDREGLPFVGRAGQLLNRIIEAMTLKRGDVYILNALKCRPPENRTPLPVEIDSCRPFVESQLEVLQPKFIVCLGAVAVRSILQTTSSVGQLRGVFHAYRGARVVVTYHPAYLLRNESAKKLVWEDMQMLMREIGLQPKRPS